MSQYSSLDVIILDEQWIAKFLWTSSKVSCENTNFNKTLMKQCAKVFFANPLNKNFSRWLWFMHQTTSRLDEGTEQVEGVFGVEKFWTSEEIEQLNEIRSFHIWREVKVFQALNEPRKENIFADNQKYKKKKYSTWRATATSSRRQHN